MSRMPHAGIDSYEHCATVRFPKGSQRAGERSCGSAVEYRRRCRGLACRLARSLSRKD